MILDLTRNYFDKYCIPLLQIKSFNALSNNKPVLDQPIKTNKKRLKNMLKRQEMMTIQHETYQTICTIKIIINSFALIYQDKQLQVLFNKLEEDDGATMIFYRLKGAKKYFKLLNI